MYGIRIDKVDGELCLRLDNGMDSNYAEMFQMFTAWQEQAEKLKSGEITKEEYDVWRYNYPKYDTTQKWAKVPSQDMSDAMVKAFKKQLKDR